MGARKTRELSARLERVRRAFEEWRRTCRPGSPIPGRLWASAAIVAGREGISRTANVLRVNYATLKKHIKPTSADASALPQEDATTTFVELPHSARVGSCQCMMELEDVGGAKMRVRLRSVEPLDLAAICRSFWNPVP
jgi:hypothetical protein